MPVSNCTYLSHISGTTATLAIIGNGSYVTCGEVGSFLNALTLRPGKTDLVVDFTRCTGLDSTFLGLLARTAIDFDKKSPGGRLIFANLQGRNLDVVKNLGLQHITEVVESPLPVSTPTGTRHERQMCDSATIVAAHTALIKAHADNEPKFSPVIAAMMQNHH